MKILIPCIQCTSAIGSDWNLRLYEASYYDAGITELKCEYGHEATYLVARPKFEMLLEAGANAFAGEFTFEACAAFAAALERLYEFVIAVLCHKQGMSEQQYDLMFKEMAKQSERQLGAFMLLYAMNFNEIYKINVKMVEFRNRVIHKGQIPDVVETREFGSYVYSVTYQLTKKIKETCKDSMWAVKMRQEAQKVSSLPLGTKTVSHGGGLFFTLNSEVNESEFNGAMKKFMEAKQAMATIAALGPIRWETTIHPQAALSNPNEAS